MGKKKWYPCELHCHTVHSDGDFTVSELIKTAKERQLSGICLTDHNTMSGHRETEQEKELTVLKGIEWTTYFGHMLVLDCKNYVDWRDALPDSIDEKILQVKNNGGLVGIAHPFQLGTPICTGGHWDYNVKDWDKVNYMEIFSEGSPFLNTPNKKAKKLWHSLLSQGYRITPTMGRDWHRTRGNVFISACTWLLCDEELTSDGMKNAIEKGRTVVSAGPLFFFETDKGETIGDTAECGETVMHFTVSDERQLQVDPDRKIVAEKIIIASKTGEKEYPLADAISINLESDSWYSAELWGSIDGRKDMLLALTAPIYTHKTGERL